MQTTSTKDRHSINTNSFPSTRDLGIVLEEADSPEIGRGGGASSTRFSYLDSIMDNNDYLQPQTSSSSSYIIGNSVDIGRPLLPLRRARAGTMPSMVYMDHSPIITPPPPLPLPSFSSQHNSNNNRHRSGSLTLPAPANFQMSNTWRSTPIEPISPSTEQLLQGDDDFSIARTLRSIGLDEEEGDQQKSSVFNNHNIRANLRNRSYSVNNTAMYQQQQQLQQQENLTPTTRSRIISNNNNIHTQQTENLNTNNINSRPRASSMGRMDYARLTPPGLSSLWKMQLGTLHDTEDLIVNEPPLSLGDSELLANIILQQNGVDGTTTVVNSSTDNLSLIDNNNLRSSNNTNNFIPPINNNQAQHQKQQLQQQQPNNSVISRSLWIGNIDASITADSLTRLFSAYGPIESVRLLMEKECAFINFYNLEDAVHAKDDVLTNLGGRVGTCIVRIGYGRAEILAVTTPIEIPVVSQPTRALWLGNMPPNTTQSTLERVFSLFGNIESIRVLSHKNCAFINYDTVESASNARDSLLQNDQRVQDLWGIRIGFAKVPLAANNNNNNSNRASPKHSLSHASSNDDIVNAHANIELWSIMKEFGAPENAIDLVNSLQSASYFESIPPVPEYGIRRRHDASRLRDIRKKLDVVTEATEADSIALDCMDELAEICSDYIGNTVVQRLFEKCSEDMKTIMLKAVAPHLAAMGVHKNGTWAAQKIIDSLKLPNQIQILCTHIQPYIPPLLLDQFGNYVVQCCLRLEGDNQFIINAMVEKFVHIAQGRFGARAIRGILEGTLITPSQQMFISAALLQNAVSLSIHANGALLVCWLIETSQLKNRYSLLASRLAPHLTQVATHKLGTQILLKLINQEVDENAKQNLLTALENQDTMRSILSDQARGLGFAIKVITSENLSSDEKIKLHEMTHPILTQLQGTGFKKALLEFVAAGEEQGTTTAVVDEK